VLVRDQLGRDPTTPFTVTARCGGGHPLVIRNHPIDVNGDPFPTLYWLTCSDAVKAVSRLEADGWIARMNARVQDDEAFDEAVEAAHRSYADERGRLAPGAEAYGGVGGTSTGVKCLHAHYAYHLAGGVDPVGGWVAERVEPIHAPARNRIAAIDQGTNSIRLIVAEPVLAENSAATHWTDVDVQELARDMVITRLGAGVDATGQLDPRALDRTIGVLARYCRRARALGTSRIRVAATSAVRDASNRSVLEDAVRAWANTELEVVSGEREAGLSFLGATHRLSAADAPPPYCIFDIGGGSTELVVGAEAPESAVSMQLGSVRLTERLVRSDPPSLDEVAAMEREVERSLDQVDAAELDVARARTLVAVAGTATTLQAMSLDLPRYDPDAIHRTWISVEEVERLVDRLARMTNAERAALPFMAPGRGDVIVAGAVIMAVTMRRFGLRRALVSETDILDGLAIEMIASL
jgi:exopolyphosphatase/guanosine-5'-triphosphate,3'-diphosphate pyrophosphatase